MQESVRDLTKLTIKLPLGNPSLKYVHTNQWLFTDLPKEFYLTNLAPLMNALNGTYNRYSGFQENRWYVEGVTINNDGTSATIELNVNPMASSLSAYTEANNKSKEDYVSAANSNSNNVATTEKTSKTKSTTLNEKGLPKLYNVNGWSKSDQEYIKKVAAYALKQAGYPQKQVKQAYVLHEHYCKTHTYGGYDCMRKYKANKSFEKVWHMNGHNCGDGAVTIKALLRCIGLKAVIMNGHGHFWVKVPIDGTNYYCDQAANSGQHNWRRLGSAGTDKNVWHGRGGEHKYEWC